MRSALEQLPERERRVLELRFGLDGEPQALETIGKELGISRERVRQIEGEAMAKLAELLGGLEADETSSCGLPSESAHFRLMKEIADDIRRWRERGDAALALATVVATRSSAPRPVGSKLAISEQGELAGSVSGGCVENEVYEELLAACWRAGRRSCSRTGSPTSRPGASACPAAARSTSSSSA